MCITKAGAGLVTVSSGYRVVIPKWAREALGIRPGQKLEVTAEGGIFRLVPLAASGKPIARAREGR